MKVLFRIPPVYIDIIRATGLKESYRITPEVAEDGFLLNYLPKDQFDLSDLLNGKSIDRVARFRISGPGVSYYKRAASLVWKDTDELKRLRGPVAIVTTSTVAFRGAFYQ